MDEEMLTPNTISQACVERAWNTRYMVSTVNARSMHGPRMVHAWSMHCPRMVHARPSTHAPLTLL